jgi:poly [ADP-ribose] polymerase 10/14/15
MDDMLTQKYRDGDQVPAVWTLGSAQSGQTVRVVLDPLQKEYSNVTALLKSSLDGRFRILRIERIQNLGQWGLYQAKKREMERRGDPGHGERRLFHGTDEATVPRIISTAFNRSYCGKNATVYGQGVYFAQDASYSALDTYSRPNGLGDKHIFLCRVLVGAYTLGDNSMRVPPPRADGVFDSTVDKMNSPSIYVTYHDAQVGAFKLLHDDIQVVADCTTEYMRHTTTLCLPVNVQKDSR